MSHHNGPRPEGQKERARALRADGLSLRLIAQRLGVPVSTVGDWLKGEGEVAMVKTCWCGANFIARSDKAQSCSLAHSAKHHAIYGRSFERQRTR